MLCIQILYKNLVYGMRVYKLYLSDAIKVLTSVNLDKGLIEIHVIKQKWKCIGKFGNHTFLKPAIFLDRIEIRGSKMQLKNLLLTLLSSLDEESWKQLNQHYSEKNRFYGAILSFQPFEVDENEED